LHAAEKEAVMSTEHTLERNWLEHYRGHNVSVVFGNGTSLHGLLRGYDHQSLELDADDATVLVYLSAVAYVRPQAAE
jgi:sRNA-binding regulator protein Hfq